MTSTSDEICNWFGSQKLNFEIHELDSGKLFTSEEIESLQTRRARELSEVGVEEGDSVFLYHPNAVSFFEDLFASWKIGAIPFIVNSSSTSIEFQQLVQKFRPKAILKPSGIEILNSSRLDQKDLSEKIAFILFTSGTTAEPKAIAYTFKSLNEKLKILQTAIPRDVRQTALCVLPLHFGHGLIGIALSSLYSGCRLALAPALSLDNIDRFQNWFENAKPDFISGTPATWSMLLRFKAVKHLSGLKRVQIASAHANHLLFDQVQEYASCPVFNVYGMTETASWVSDHLYQKAGDECIVGNGQNYKTEFRIQNLDATGVGDIHISTPVRGRPIPQNALDHSKSTAKWHSTGDVGLMNSKGQVQIFGRQSRIINRRGIKVSAEEVEQYLLLENQVSDACVLGVGEFFNEVGALIVLKDRSLNEIEFNSRLIQSLVAKISSYKIPNVFKYVDSIPRNSYGKVDLKKAVLLWTQSI